MSSKNNRPSLMSRILGPRGNPIAKDAEKIMIGVIANDNPPVEFATSLGAICAKPEALIMLNQRVTDLNFPVSILRNSLVLDAKQAGVDRLLLINADMGLPPDTIPQLLAWGDRDVVGACYRSRVPPFNLIVGAKDGKPSNVEHGITEVDVLPLGCCLIKMSVFDKLDSPFFREPYAPQSEGIIGGIVPDFVDFSNRVRAAGFKVWADITLTAQVGHIGRNLFMAKEEYGEPRVAQDRRTAQAG